MGTVNPIAKLGPEHIGLVVIVQAFDRKNVGSDMIVPESLNKVVGRLQSFGTYKNLLNVKFEGVDGADQFDVVDSYVELFVYREQRMTVINRP